MDYSTGTISQIWELYKFTHEGTDYLYTSENQDVTVDGDTYTAAALEREQVEKDSDFSRGRLKIRCVQTPLLLSFLAISPPSTIAVTVYRHQPYISTPVTEVLFEGKVESIAFELGQRCQITAIEAQEFVFYKFPAWVYQPTCNHVLYSTDCGLTRASYKNTVTAEVLTTPAVMWSSGANINGDKYYSWGTAEFNGEKRLIIAQNGEQVVFQVPFTSLEVGDSVDLYPGCTKTASECKNKFSNLSKFMGFPHIPRKNPIWTGL